MEPSVSPDLPIRWHSISAHMGATALARTDLASWAQTLMPLHPVEAPGAPVESKSRTYHGRVGSVRTAGWRGGVGHDWVPTELFVHETSLARTLQSIEYTSLERLSRSTNKRNPM